MRRTRFTLVVAAVGALTVPTVLGACGGGDGGSAAPAPSEPVAVPVSGPADGAASAEPEDDTAAADDAPTDGDDAADEATSDPGSAASDVTTDGGSSTGGEQPTLSWQPVEGALLYSVVVLTADGQPFWGWLGESANVTVGNGAPDPLVSPDMTWTVVALDADDNPIWESDPLPV